MRLARNREFFVGGRAPRITKLTGRERESAAAFYSACAQNGDPCALPEPEPRQSQSTHAAAVPAANVCEPSSESGVNP